jgi:hypothetical protein
MPTWPVSLPQTPLIAGYSEQPPDIIVETKMDAGPPKARRRFSAGIRPIKVKMLMTTAQVETLDVFYITTLAGGALTFDYTHPRTEASETYRIGKLLYTHISNDFYDVSFELKQQP